MPLGNEKRNSFMADRKAFPMGVLGRKTGRFAISVCQKTRK